MVGMGMMGMMGGSGAGCGRPHRIWHIERMGDGSYVAIATLIPAANIVAAE